MKHIKLYEQFLNESVIPAMLDWPSNKGMLINWLKKEDELPDPGLSTDIQALHLVWALGRYANRVLDVGDEFDQHDTDSLMDFAETILPELLKIKK